MFDGNVSFQPFPQIGNQQFNQFPAGSPLSGLMAQNPSPPQSILPQIGAFPHISDGGASPNFIQNICPSPGGISPGPFGGGMDFCSPFGGGMNPGPFGAGMDFGSPFGGGMSPGPFGAGMNFGSPFGGGMSPGPFGAGMDFGSPFGGGMSPGPFGAGMDFGSPFGGGMSPGPFGAGMDFGSPFGGGMSPGPFGAGMDFGSPFGGVISPDPFGGMMSPVGPPPSPISGQGAVRNDNPISDQYFTGRYGVNQNNLWKMAIDMRRWQQDPGNPGKPYGPTAFDKEDPGFVNAVFNAYDVAMQQGLNVPLNQGGRMWNPDALEQVHDMAINGLPAHSPEGVKMPGYRNGPPQGFAAFDMVTTGETPYVTQEGIQELINRPDTAIVDLTASGMPMMPGPPNPQQDRMMIGGGVSQGSPDASYQVTILQRDPSGNPSFVRYYSFRNQPGIAKPMDNELFNNFYGRIGQAQTQDEKLGLIAGVVKEMELRHPFSDANGRTSMILLNSLLEQNGFKPTILSDPNNIDGFSHSQLVDDIKAGWQRFDALR